MRITLFILIILISHSSFSQKRSDTLNLLENISEVYMQSMYIEKNFDSASKMWDRSIFIEAGKYYLSQKKEALGDDAILKMIKNAYSSYYIESAQFKVLDLAVYSFRNPIGYSREVRLVYNCSERTKGKLKKIRVGLYFISHDQGMNWLIQDSKIIEITNRYN